MNKSYKVVFNKVRGALMVANEMTSSVQKNGTKTVVALAAGLTMSMGASADVSWDVQNQETTVSGWGGALGLLKDTQTANEGLVSNNVLTADGAVLGGVAALYKATSSLSDITFDNNQLSTNAVAENASDKGTEDTTSMGGILMIKNGSTTLTDVVFTNNKIISTGTGVGTFVAGAAIYEDAVINATDGTLPSALTIAATKDLTYSGNNVISATPDTYYGLYGTVSTSAGGFLFLDRQSRTTFDVSDGATLRIGTTESTGNMDSIASSIGINGKVSTTGFAKAGAGTLEINSDLNKFYGLVDVKEGTMSVTKKWNITNKVVVDAGAVLRLNDFSLGKSPVSLTWNGTNYTEGDGKLVVTNGAIVVNGTLQGTSANIFTTTNDGKLIAATAEEVTGEGAALLAGITGNGTLAVVDQGVYTTDSLKGMTAAAKDFTLSIVNATLASGETAELVDGIIQATEVASTTADSGTLKANNTGAQSVKVTSGLNEDGSLTLDGQLTVTGSTTSAPAFQTADGTNLAKLEVKDGSTLNIGSTAAAAGAPKAVVELPTELVLASGSTTTLANVDAKAETLKVSGNLNVGTADAAANLEVNTFDLGSDSTVNFAKTEAKIETLTGAGTMNVGTTENAAKVVVESIDGFTGTAFVDPAWSGVTEMDVVANASQFAVSSATTVAADLIAGQNSMITLGASADTAIAAFNKLSTESGITWGEDNVTAGMYINRPVTLTGGLMVDGSLTSAPGALTGGTATVASHGLLMVNQANVVEDTPFIAGTVSFDANGALGIVNATDGKFQLASNVSGATDNVYTDNSFVSASIVGNDVVTSVNAAGLGSAIASMGIQQTTRRADQMLASAIADRTSFDQTLTDGVNLWVDVAGERFDMDGLENGGKFKSDMAYATFGADAAVLDGVRVGGALQYADGSARSANYGLKNSADAISLTGYASWQPCENGKLVADIAYTKGSNDITSSVESKLNQSVDTEMYSFGVKAQYQAKAGAFSFVPSVGVRVSSLKTDEMKVGAVRIEDQSQTIVQVPVALRINAADMTAGAWTVAPSFKIAYVPTFGDDDVKIGNARQTVLDMSPVQGEFGLRAANGNLMVNANMMLGGGSDGASSVGGKIGVKYVF